MTKIYELTKEDKREIEYKNLKAFWNEVNAMYIRDKIQYRQLTQDGLIVQDEIFLKELNKRKTKTRIARDSEAETQRLIEDEISNL